MVGRGVLAPLTMTQDGPGRTVKVSAAPWLDCKPLKSRIPPSLPKDAAPGPKVALRASSLGMERQGLWEMCVGTVVGRVKIQGQEARPCASRPEATGDGLGKDGSIDLTARGLQATGFPGQRGFVPRAPGLEHQLCRPQAQ